jgi:hypothetical protein
LFEEKIVKLLKHITVLPHCLFAFKFICQNLKGTVANLGSFETTKILLWQKIKA